MLAALIQEETLPGDFAGHALRFLTPLAERLAQRYQKSGDTLVVGISVARAPPHVIKHVHQTQFFLLLTGVAAWGSCQQPTGCKTNYLPHPNVGGAL